MLQVRVRVYDNGTPPKWATTLAEVTVDRNLQCPRFRQDSRSLEVLETADVGSELVTVEVDDNDDRVSWKPECLPSVSFQNVPPYVLFKAPHNQVRLSLVGDDLALQYFIINEQTGQLFQRRSILTDPDATKQYTVSSECMW